MTESNSEKVLGYQDFFPYPSYRPNQEKSIQGMIEATALQKNTLLIATNGTGKTIMALSSVLPVAKSFKKKIIFLARTYTQNERVIQESKEIIHFFNQNNISESIGALSLRGRNEMCIHKTIQRLNLPPTDSMSVCLNLRKNKKCQFFSKLTTPKNKEIVEELIKDLAITPLSSTELINIAEDEGMCPYFMSKMLIKHVDIVVCNYQWIFNPPIRDVLLQFLECKLSDLIIIMDESHNLAEMANDLNSFKLTPYSLRQSIKDLDIFRASFKLINFVKSLQKILNDVKDKVDGELEVKPIKLINLILKKNEMSSLNDLEDMVDDLISYGEAINKEKTDQGKIAIDFISNITEFFSVFFENYEDNAYFTCFTKTQSKKGKNNLALELKCSQPRLITDNIFKKSFATLSLSGTLNPAIYTKLLGLDQTGKLLKIIKMKAPFPKKNLKVIRINKLNTKGTNRTPAMYKAIVNALSPIIKNTPKNVGIFCASYQVINGLIENGFEEMMRNTNKTLFQEKQGITAGDNDIIIEKYKDHSSKRIKGKNGAVLLGVCGGRNSEGEDFPGDFMNTVVIVGIPFQQPTPSLASRIKYYDEIFKGEGREYAYFAPALRKSNQAAGRPIRRMNDKGLVVLMDDRYKYYERHITKWIIENIKEIPYNTTLIEKEVKKFFLRFENSQNNN